MATGITDTKPSEPRAGGNKPPAGKNRKWLVYGVAGLGGVLLLSRGGSSGGGSQSANDQLSAYQTGVNDASNLIGATTGSSGIGFGSGDGVTVNPPAPITSESTARPAVNVNVNEPKPGGTSRPGKTKKPVRRKVKPKAHKPPPRRRPPHPKTAPKRKPAPARRSGGHPDTRKVTPHGTKKASPAVVESPFGAGSGQVVMGRVFPGAIGHRIGPTRRAADGSITRTVTVDYGGHTDRFLCHGNGQRWTDNPLGMNPPSRGTPFLSDPIPV